MMSKVWAVDIEWDVDDEESLENLPRKVKIPEGTDEEDVSDYLSDLTGYCHKGYVLIEMRLSQSHWL